jgi:hypothetical protein
LAHAFLWEDSDKRLKLAQLLANVVPFSLRSRDDVEGFLAAAAVHEAVSGHLRARHPLNLKFTGLTHNFPVDPAV